MWEGVECYIIKSPFLPDMLIWLTYESMEYQAIAACDISLSVLQEFQT